MIEQLRRQRRQRLAAAVTQDAHGAAADGRGATAAAAAALPMPKILTDDFGILATRETVGAGAGFTSTGAAESVTAGTAPAEDDATG